MTLIRFLVPPTSLTRFLAITFYFAMATRSTGSQSSDSTTHRLAALIAWSSGRRRWPRILKALKGVEHGSSKWAPVTNHIFCEFSGRSVKHEVGEVVVWLKTALHSVVDAGLDCTGYGGWTIMSCKRVEC